jgi:hypothetical protein
MQPTLEKLVPEKAPQIKQKQAALKKTAPPEVADFEGFSAMSNPEAKPEDLIKSAAKMPAGARGFVYERAVRQLVDKGEAERARQLLNEAPAGADRDKALASLDSKLAEKAVKDDKFEEARKIIDKISNKTAQTEQLVKLAVGFHNKNTKESKEAALKLMEEARRSVDENPQNEDEINALLAVIAGYAVVKPDLAFSLLSPLIDQTNELTQAAALLSKYNKRDRRFRNGEMSFALGLGQMQMRGFRYGKEIGLLAAADFERTRSLTDKLQRPDAQIYARLVLAQSILSERNAPSANNQFFSEDIGEGIVIMN